MKIKILAACAFVLCLSMFVSAQMPNKTDDKAMKHDDKAMKSDDKAMKSDDKMMKSDDKMMKNMTPEEMLTHMEKDVWQHLVDKKYDEFDKMLADDYQGVYADMITTKAAESAQVRKMTFKSADVSDTKVKFIDKDAAVLTSTVHANMMMPDGKETNNAERTTTIWAKRDGKWMIVYHSDMMMK